MKIKELSTTFYTDKVEECKQFYCRYFDAKTTFDCGWYVVIRIESDNEVPFYLSFQRPDGDVKRGESVGITLNMKVEDVDACYRMLKNMDLSFVEDITDHQWGDRAFRLLDPSGNIVYVYSEREVGEEYKNAVK